MEATKSSRKRRSPNKGFRRGFLLGPSATSRTQQQRSRRTGGSVHSIERLKNRDNDEERNVCSDLLQFEDEEQRATPNEKQDTHPFWILSSDGNDENDQQDEPIQEQQPIIPFISSNDSKDDGFRMEVVSTKSRKRQSSSSSPLIQEVSPQTEKTLEPTSRSPSHDSTQLTKEDTNGGHPMASGPLMVEVLEPASMPRGATRNEDGEETDDGRVEATGRQHGDSTVDISSLRVALSRVLWQIQRQSNKHEKEIIARDFVSQQELSSRSQLEYIWDSILEACATRDADSSVPEVQLALAIIQGAPDGLSSLSAFLAPTTEERSRVLAMGAILVLQCQLDCITTEEREEDSSTRHIGTLLDLIFPSLINVVVQSASSQRKTVLSHHCTVVSSEVLTLASKVACRKADDVVLLQSVYKTLSPVEKLVKVHQKWLGVSSLTEHNFANLSHDASRKHCTMAVFQDWLRVIKICETEYQDLCLEGSDQQNSMVSVAHYWAEQAGGVQLEEIASVGSLAQTFGSDRQRLAPGDVMKCLEAACGLMQLSREEENPDQVESIQDRLCSVLRGVTAWLGQSKKNLRRLAKMSIADKSHDENSNSIHRAMELLMNLLRCNSEKSTNLVLACLNYLWADSEGLPPDFLQQPDAVTSKGGVPPSFGLLLDELKSTVSATHDVIGEADASFELDPSTKALSLIVSRCIIRKGKPLLDETMSRNGVNDATVEVLALLISQTISASADLEAEDSLANQAGTILLNGIRSNPSVRRKLRNSPALLSGLPLKLTVPKLIQILAEEIQSGKDVVAVVTASLTQILEMNKAHLKKLISVLIDSLLQIKPIGEESNLIEKLCASFGGSWRRSLLRDSSFGEDGLSVVLVEIGKTMFSMPAILAPLTLFGSIVGDELSLSEASNTERRRVDLATLALLRLSLSALDALQAPSSIVEGEGGASSESVEFDRISPLLLLRRLPSIYYRISSQMHAKDNERVFDCLLDKLCNILELRLEIESSGNTTFTEDERRLSAEIAGRCLPYYADGEPTPPPCCFDRICTPAFGKALAALGDVSCTSQESFRRAMRASRAAVYATCHYLSNAHDDDNGKGLLTTASFALKMLAMEPHGDNLGTESIDDEDMIQLQTGCIEFFAVCLESLLQRNLEHQRASSEHLVIELPSRRIELVRDGRTGTNTLRALSRISSTLMDIVRTGISDSKWIDSCDALFEAGTRRSTSRDTRRQFSTPPRTCLLNSFLVVSQRISKHGGKLDEWASMTGPWILEWGNGGKVDLDLRHPLCMAAALQITFVLITRTKSFDSLSGKPPDREKQRIVIRLAYKWALESLKSNINGVGEYSASAMRTAALKLMLAIVTIDLIEDGSTWQGCLGPGDLGESFSILQGAANMDSDENVRQLSSQVLARMLA